MPCETSHILVKVAARCVVLVMTYLIVCERATGKVCDGTSKNNGTSPGARVANLIAVEDGVYKGTT